MFILFRASIYFTNHRDFIQHSTCIVHIGAYTFRFMSDFQWELLGAILILAEDIFFWILMEMPSHKGFLQTTGIQAFLKRLKWLRDIALVVTSSIVSPILWIWEQFWSLPVIGIITVLLYGLGVDAMYGNDFKIAAALYFVATVLIALKICSQKEVRDHPNSGGIQLVVILLSTSVFVASLLWIDHRKGPAAISKTQPPQERTKPVQNPPVSKEPPMQPPPRTSVNIHKESQSFAFTESISDTVTVLLDNGANIHFEVHLQSTSIQKQKSNGLLNLDGERPLTVYIQDGTFYVDASITDGSGHKAIQIERNKLEVNPSGWDRNFSANAVEVVDSSQRPVFQMIRKRANLIQISGLFISSKGSVFDARPPKALFKYPAWKYPGEYAEQSPGESPDESPGNPYSPNALSQLTSAELRAQTQTLCTQIRALSKEWNEGYFENNKKALQAMNAAKSQEVRKFYANQRMAGNEQLFRSLEARFNREYRRNAKSLIVKLSLRVNRPTDAFKPPLGATAVGVWCGSGL